MIEVVIIGCSAVIIFLLIFLLGTEASENIGQVEKYKCLDESMCRTESVLKRCHEDLVKRHETDLAQLKALKRFFTLTAKFDSGVDEEE